MSTYKVDPVPIEALRQNSLRQDSNPPPGEYESPALPTEPLRDAPWERFELPTTHVRIVLLCPLSYQGWCQSLELIAENHQAKAQPAS